MRRVRIIFKTHLDIGFTDLAVRVVDSLEDALTHIAQYGTGHSECIVTDSATAAEAG